MLCSRSDPARLTLGVRSVYLQSPGAGGFEVCPSSATADILGEQPDVPTGQGAHPTWGGAAAPAALPRSPSSRTAAGTLHRLQRYLKFPVQSPKGKNTHLQSLSPPVIINNCKSVIKSMFQRNSSLRTSLTFFVFLPPGQDRWAQEECALLAGGVLFPAQASAQLLGPRRSSRQAFLILSPASR